MKRQKSPWTQALNFFSFKDNRVILLFLKKLNDIKAPKC